MPHNFFLITFLLASFPLVAQRTVLSFPTDLAVTSKDSNCQSFILPDDRTGKTTIVLKGNDKAEYLLVNKNFEIESKVQPKNGLISTIFAKDYEKYLAGVTNNLGSCFYYMIDRNHFNMEIVNFANSSIINKPIFDKPDDEKNIEWFTSQGRFYLLAVNEKKGELALYVVDENGVVSHKNISVELNGYNPDKLTIREYFSYSHVFYPKQETELLEAIELTKIYPYPGKVVIIVGDGKEPPHVWTIDLQTYNISKRKFDLSGFTGFNGKKEKFYNNTYLYGENLLVLNTSKQKIEIGIFNFNSGRLIRKHEITESSNIQFLEKPIKILTNSSTSKVNKIESNKELIKEMFKGSNGIAIGLNNKGQLIVTCGVYRKETGTFTPGIYSEVNRPMSVPTTGVYPSSNIAAVRVYTERQRKYSFSRTVNFKIILDSSDFKLLSPSEKRSTIDKINHFLKSLPEETQAINTFIINNNYYLGYYLPKEKSFVIKEMEK